ncbi:hypothetical protein RJZ56_006880 [Blastomyces dermatitidis]|uniref:Uncharacterized protein n=3 Tax=Blastomyces TaxID=229219 RepID=A0A179V478_BLAGS|nr:uncharacterized protein BDBG_09290 [Blastomyces gilchristii SLH14081]XP_045273198.1 uncharacterized protein BDCG_08714 [Blastomyces dermatitidis ER-3]EGE84927.1 hypothetical protein BDDG_07872 [Blastomyces dermatitidis ATCC 18188]EQL33544.1 hypothetical protein BDFG_04472 [Blastomyces dermatitidis ATCC 26199]EEQ85445.1 hypothetical protein BDCG_08714 [Blastomyces dermatitidis ER-3]OAT14227.1 hypothetical protein BDBG_09290 [Blastomyces gilchristii SLH14081]
MSVSASEADIVFNRANVALARSQRLVASWLPPKTAEEIANTKTEEELQREEDEIFTPVPDKLGLGAPLPKSQQDGSSNRTELSSNEKLRKQLLGKNYKKFTPSVPVTGSRPLPDTKLKHHQRHQRAKPQPESDDDDEDEGRSSLGRNKRKRVRTGVEGGDEVTTTTATKPAAGNHNDNGDDNQSDDGSAQRSTQRKKPVSYLDELLAERSKRRKKKKNKE